MCASTAGLLSSKSVMLAIVTLNQLWVTNWDELGIESEKKGQCWAENLHNTFNQMFLSIVKVQVHRSIHPLLQLPALTWSCSLWKQSCRTVRRCSCLYGHHKYTKSLPHSALAHSQGILWLKPDCACPTQRDQKNRLQLHILCTRGECRNMHTHGCSICCLDCIFIILLSICV